MKELKVGFNTNFKTIFKDQSLSQSSIAIDDNPLHELKVMRRQLSEPF